MPNFDSDSPLVEMGQAGLEFVAQFELEKVLGEFESNLLEVVAEKNRQPSDPPQSSPGG